MAPAAAIAQAIDPQLGMIDWVLVTIAALVVLGAVYALVSASLTLGPPWWLLVLTVVVVPGTFVLRSRGFMRARRMVAFGTLAATTVAITVDQL